MDSGQVEGAAHELHRNGLQHHSSTAPGSDAVGATTNADEAETSSESFEEENKSISSAKGSVHSTIPPLASHPPTPSRLLDLFRRRQKTDDWDAIATQPSVFDDSDFAKRNAAHPLWENRDRFDPLFRWTWGEERKLVRKLDYRVALWAMIMFFCLDLDRENISQANSDNLLENLGLTTNDYNLGNTLFKVAFLCAELPSQLISKRVGADRWIPAQICLWSLFSGAQFWMKNRTQFLVLRFFTGALQGGFIPDTLLFLSYFYTKQELPLRLAVFWLSNYLVKIIGPFLALGLLKLRGHGGHAGWQYLFLIEALLTLSVGIFSFVNMPAGPTQTKNWFWRDGWFTEHEEKMIVNRVIRDDPTKGSMHNRQGIDWKGFWTSLKDYDMWPLYLIGVTFLTPSYPLANYLTLQLKHLGFSTEETNALSVPAPLIGVFTLFLVVIVSEVVNNRSFVSMSISVWFAVFGFVLYGLPSDASPWTYWAVCTLQQAYPYVHAIQVAWISRQSGSVRTRTISAALYNMLVQVSAIAGANVYQKSDSPLYRKGNLAMAILPLCTCFIYIGTFFYYRWRNNTRDRIWNAMSKEEQLHYLDTTTDEGNRRLDFRFAT